VVTRHHPRRAGRTKYGIGRAPRVLLDLITVKFMLDYLASPMKLFGMIGLACGAVGLGAGLVTMVMKLAAGIDMTGNPLLLLTAFSMMIGMQFLSLGLLSELLVRMYYNRDGQAHYAVRRKINFQPSGNMPRRQAA
jgi:hypothetical protein